MIDEDHTGPLAHDNDVGLELALRVHRAELPRQFDRDAERLLVECRTRAQYERRLDDLVDHILEREPMAPEPGLFRGLVITGAGADGEIEISSEDGEEISQERIGKALAAYKWEMKADLRRAVEKDVGPMLEVRKRYWLRRFDERAEKPRTSVEFMPVIDAAYTVEEMPTAPPLPQIAPVTRRRRRIVEVEDLDVLASRQETRVRWLDEQLSCKNWSSDLDIAANGGPSYNTVGRFRTGKLSAQDRYVRGKLAAAFGCKLGDVPE